MPFLTPSGEAPYSYILGEYPKNVNIKAVYRSEKIGLPIIPSLILSISL
jgi:hypothetical protein